MKGWGGRKRKAKSGSYFF